MTTKGVDDQAVQTLILRARAVIDLAEALDEELARIDSVGAARPRWSCRCRRCWPAWRPRASRWICEQLTELQSQFGDQIRDAAEAAYAVIGKQINLGSPKQLQVVLFDELEMPKTKRTKTGYTTDADALQGLFDKTGHPFLQHLLAHRDVTRLKVTVDGLLNVGGRRRAHPHHVQPDHRRDRPAVVDRAQPAEHPHPHRGGPRDPGRVRRRRRATRELMTADYSQIEMRIMAHLSKDDGLIEAFNTGEDLHSFVASRAFGVADRRGHRRTAAPGQGDVVWAGLRVERLRVGRAAEDLHRGGQGADGSVLRPVRRGARLPAVGGRPGPQGRLHLDGVRPPAVSARAGQQQPPGPRRPPSGPRSTRRSRAAPPTSSRSR